MQPKIQFDWAQIDKVTWRREHPDEATLGPFGSIAG
jgi:hypothetical protein